MRITVAIGAFLSMPPAPAGAIEKIWARLCAEFASRGHETTVVCPAYDGLPAESVIDGVRYLRHSGFERTRSTWTDLPRDWRYSRAISRILPPADITVTNAFFLPVMLRGHRHAGAIHVHLQRFPKKQMRLYRHVDRISTVSQAIADAIVAQTPSVADLVRIIPNPVDVTVFRPADDPSAANAAHSEHARTVLYTGRVHPEKGLDLLIDAFRIARERHADLALRIVGPHESGQGGGGEAYLASLKRRAEGLPVRFDGRIVGVEPLVEALRAASFYVYPSVAFFGEASPVAPLEAMACGLVPIVSDLPQFAMYLRDGETGLVFAREGEGAAERLAACIDRLASDDALRSRLRVAGLEQARRLDASHVADRYLEDFAEVIEARRARVGGTGHRT